MGRRKAAAAIDEGDFEFDEQELDAQGVDRTPLVLQKEPKPRKVALMAAGVKQIRCVSCSRITAIADSFEFGDGWICGKCFPEGVVVNG
jgi:hypothetical protein